MFIDSVLDLLGEADISISKPNTQNINGLDSQQDSVSVTRTMTLFSTPDSICLLANIFTVNTTMPVNAHYPINEY